MKQHNVDYRKEKRPHESKQNQQQQPLIQQHPSQSRRPVLQQRASVVLPRRGDSKYYPPQTYNGVKLHDLFSEKEPRFDLFAWQLKAKAQPLHKVIQTARKTVTTHEWKVNILIFCRIYLCEG